LDGGSVVPVLALDLREDDNVLDMCAAPGGKSLMIAQTNRFGLIISASILINFSVSILSYP
jgi:16S rRNA C967 or C1407 C5-methylase (RsmB/RsmF family)